MRINIEHVEKSTGVLRKRKHHGIAVTVHFSDQERAIIQERKLEKDIILEREPPSDIDADKHESRGIAKRLATAAISGADANHHHLTINKLMKGTETYWVSTPVEAKMYEDELKTALVQMKDYITANEEIQEKSSSFEL